MNKKKTVWIKSFSKCTSSQFFEKNNIGCTKKDNIDIFSAFIESFLTP